MSYEPEKKQRGVGHRWEPGQSGNPAGRPKSPSFKKLIQDLPEEEKVKVIERMKLVVAKGRPGDAVRAAEWLAKHSAETGVVSVETDHFTVSISPPAAFYDEEESA